jgi:glycosyltransferase involved in cell wall biosynthesis
MCYGWKYRDNALAETKKWLLTRTQCLWKGIARRALQSKYRIPYESCDKLVVLSQYYFPTYLYYAGVPHSDKMAAIGNSLRFTDYVSEKDIATKEKTVIVVARFDEDTKRISLAMKAWRQIEADSQFNEWKLQLVGDGRDRRFYEFLVRKWQLKRVEFTGQQNPQEYYRKASIFLMTSTAEGWGMVMTEAQQMGVPVVAMDSFGSLHDIITDGVNGRIVPNNDLYAFTSAMKELMGDSLIRLSMARNAVEGSKCFEISHVLQKWSQVFDELKKCKA